MGGLAKEELGIEGEPLGRRLLRLLGDSFDTIIVVTKNPGNYEGTGARTTSDLAPGFGPLSGLHAALVAAGDPAGESGWIWLSACDMPAFDPRLVLLLSARLETALARAAGTGGEPPLACLARFGGHFEPFHALYSRALLPRLEALFATAREARLQGEAAAPRSIREPSFKELLAGAPVEYVEEAAVRELTPDWGLFFNINRPGDLETWRVARNTTN
jgi:molybdopterin-guanine dinucleotide biosynthesis protein A